MKTTIAVMLCLVLSLIATGCIFLGERHSLTRTVLLNFPPRQEQTNVSLSVSDSEVQDTLKLIDAVLNAEGFVREPDPHETSMPSLVARYARYVKYDGGELRIGILPDVYIQQEQLEVVIVELGNRSTHPSEITKRICSSLQKELSSRYGKDRVKVENF
jgi:hypothetical protein